MRTAVISDIHANLEALVTVLGRIEELNVDETVCLGDIVGYNADPNDCLAIIRREKILCVTGNHDVAACGLEDPDGFNPPARAAVFWTREHLTEENRQFLRCLPREQRVRDMFLFHGSIHDTNRYIQSHNDAVDNFRLLTGLGGEVRLGFFGHTHVSIALSERQGAVSSEQSLELSLSSENRYLINPGSVGQPRDGNPRAAFLVYDSSERRVIFHRVEYDIRKCRDKIIRAGLPTRLAERLEWGR